MRVIDYTKFSLAALAAALLSSCASTTMQSVQRSPQFQPTQIHKVLVVGLMKTPGLRKIFEDEFVRQWRQRGVEAVASLDVLPSGTTLDKAGVAPFAKAQGYDCVLVTRLVDQKTVDRTVHVKEYKSAGSTPWEDSSNLSEQMQVVVASPEYDIDYKVALVSTNIYDVPTELRVWSGITQTLMTGDVPKLIRPFIKVVLKNLYEGH